MPSPSDVTVIVCSRNRSEMLRDGLAAILSSTPAEADVLVVDSASDTAETRDVATDAGVASTRAGRGLSVARNAGITTATRPLVVFTDDDCRPTEGWIEHLIVPFADDRVAAVTGRMLDHTSSADAPYDRPARYETAISGLDAGHGAVMAFRRDVLLRLGGFDDLMGAGQRLAGAEDLDIFIRLLRAGAHVVHSAECVVLHANTRVGAAYVELHRGYGLGLGALVGKWLRRDPRFGVRIGWTLTRRTVARIARARRQGRAFEHERALLGGIFAGAWAVRRAPIVGERFVPPWSPDGMPTLRMEGALA
ncbi:glycosyltransferase [Microbacterium trichothecenolyticum]|uniref:Glycosyl transferase family 2 n=1 Tax=Microbacterium trichothecenolyticum TaxID=69370 RepID=A0A0M2H1T2_MICTR|nr:glycosyltransferase [Microbacterium trichothecenolyticum]KJL40343.1 Glycosyl transferase family 2 [Microbacterium trichothecenolyticum]